MLPTLGPFARCLFQILVGGGTESFRRDRLLSGIDDSTLRNYVGFYSQCFLLFRGAAMKDSWIKAWKQQIGRRQMDKSDEAKTITLNVMLNSTRNLTNAFGQIQLTKDLKIPTLFVISVANY